MAELLEPYAGHRHRVQRLVELAGLSQTETRSANGPQDAPSRLTSALAGPDPAGTSRETGAQ